MAKINEITVDIKANLIGDQKTAETCLKLVELYINETGSTIIYHRGENGELNGHFGLGG